MRKFERVATIGIVVLAAGACSGVASAASNATGAATATMTALGRDFAVDSTRLAVGHPVTFSGTGCPHHDLVFAGVGVTSVTTGTQAEASPALDRTWSATVTVGDSTLLGTLRGDVAAVASCVRATDHAIVFSYKPIRVHVATFRKLRLTPGATLAPGAALHVVPSAGCPKDVINSGAFAGIIHVGDFAGSSQGIGPGAAQFVAVGHAGNWSADLTVPADTTPGQYVLTAYCLYSRSYTAWYRTVSITVTG